MLRDGGVKTSEIGRSDTFVRAPELTEARSSDIERGGLRASGDPGEHDVNNSEADPRGDITLS